MGRKSQRAKRNLAAKKRGDSDEEYYSDVDDGKSAETNNNDSACAEATTKPSKDLDFAQRRELQRKKASEKRKLKQKCYLCNKVGHVRRECPGIQDDGRGMSRYKGKSDTKSEKQKYLAKKQNHQKSGGRAGGGDGLQSGSKGIISLFDYYPEGFLFRDIDNDQDNDDDEKDEKYKNTSHYYYDVGCDYLETIEYLRYGRGKHKISYKEAIEEYENILQFATSSEKQRWKLGSMISRTVLERIDRPWEDPTPPFLKSDTATTNMNTMLYFMLGLSSKFLNNKQDQQHQQKREEKLKEDDGANTGDNINKEEEAEVDIILQSLIDTVNSSSSIIIGVWSSLDYTSDKIRRTGYDRISQLNRLRCCCKAAGETNLPISIQLLPGAAGLMTRNSSDDSNVGGTDVPNVKGTDYAKVLLDFQEIVAETIHIYPNIVIVLSCWSGFADHMMSFLKTFPVNLWISLGGSVSFQKLTYLHECAFDVPLDKLLLETSTVIPSCVANLLGRDASYHSGYWPFVVQAVEKYKSATGSCTVEDVANAVSENAINCYPKLLQQPKQ